MRKLTRREALACFGAGLVGTGVYGNLTSRDIHVDRRTIELDHWEADGFKVVQISDVHVNDEAQTKTAQRAVELAIREKPDLLVFPGDFVNYPADECVRKIPIAFEALEELTCPRLAILGNHDYWCGDVEKVIQYAKKTPLRLLRNEAVDYQGVRIVGLDDAMEKRHDLTLLGEPRHTTLVLLHEPDFVVELPSHVSLQLSGHSHGGEICLPGGFPLYTPTGSKRYKSGYYDRKTARLCEPGHGDAGALPNLLSSRNQCAHPALGLNRAGKGRI